MKYSMFDWCARVIEYTKRIIQWQNEKFSEETICYIYNDINKCSDKSSDQNKNFNRVSYNIHTPT